MIDFAFEQLNYIYLTVNMCLINCVYLHGAWLTGKVSDASDIPK